MAKIIKIRPIVDQYKTAHDISEQYTSRLTAQLLNKGLVGKEINDETLDDIVSFFHSEDVAKAMKKALGDKAEKLSDEEVLDRYGLPKHAIKEALSEYKSVTPEALLSLVRQLSTRIHTELTSHHPASLANIAYDDIDEAQKIIDELYRTSGGDQYANAHEKAIKNLKTPDKVLEHMQGLYQRGDLQARMAQDSERLREAVYKDGGEGGKIIKLPGAKGEEKEKPRYRKAA